MEFKGTKGKWYVSKAYKTINDEKGFGIAQENGVRNSKEWDANALLISKAPEMLEMLEECRTQLILCTLIDKSGQCSEMVDKLEQLIKEANEL